MVEQLIQHGLQHEMKAGSVDKHSTQSHHVQYFDYDEELQLAN